MNVKIELSYLEIYLEDCYDLLTKETVANNATTGEKKVLSLRETNTGETYLDGLNSLTISNIQEVVNYLTIANKVRSTGKTAMNNASSRSHAICIITVTTTKKDGTTLISKLNLVDLAGSERAKKTQATGEVFQEGVSINKGLLALGNVVAALSQKSSNAAAALAQPPSTQPAQSQHIHVPYRESKLTRLLKDSLGGNGLTVLLACLSPAATNYDESLNTLRFASRASSIINSAKINSQLAVAGNGGAVESLVKEVASLRDEYALLQEKYNALVLSSLDKQQQEDKEKDLLSFCSNHSMLSAASSASSSSASTGGQGQRGEAMVSYFTAVLKFVVSLKNLLMFCFSEDLYLDENELFSLSLELKDIRNIFGIEYARPALPAPTASSSGEEKEMAELLKGLNFDCEEPNIIALIDELKFLENHFRESQLKLLTAAKKAHGPGNTVAPRPSLASLDNQPAKAKAPAPAPAQIEGLPTAPALAGGEGGAGGDESFLSGIHHLNTSSHQLGRLSHSLDLSHAEADDLMAEDEGVPGVEEEEGDGMLLPEAAGLAQEIEVHEEKLSGLQVLAEQYASTIHGLHQEIAQLEQEKVAIQAKQKQITSAAPPSRAFGGGFSSSSSSSASSSAQQQLALKNELRSKQQQLEEKMKLLQRKEKELRTITNNKEALVKQMDFLAEKLRYYKTNQVLIMKKLHEKEVAHQQKTKEFQKADNVKSKQLNAQTLSIQRLTNQLSMKERLFQSHLQKKEKEMNWLKDLLVLKDAKASKAATTTTSTNGSGKLGGAAGSMKSSSSNNKSSAPAANAMGPPPPTFQKQFATLLAESVAAEKERVAARLLLSHHLEQKAALSRQKGRLEELLRTMLRDDRKKSTRTAMRKQFFLQQKIAALQDRLAEKAELVKSLQSLNCLKQTAADQDGRGGLGPLLQLLEDSSAAASSSSVLRSCVQRLWAVVASGLQERERMAVELAEARETAARMKSFFLGTSAAAAACPSFSFAALGEEQREAALFSFCGEEDLATVADLDRLHGLSAGLADGFTFSAARGGAGDLSGSSFREAGEFDDEDEESDDGGRGEAGLDETFYPSGPEDSEAEAGSQADEDEDDPADYPNKGRRGGGGRGRGGRKKRKNPFNSSASASDLREADEESPRKRRAADRREEDSGEESAAFEESDGRSSSEEEDSDDDSRPGRKRGGARKKNAPKAAGGKKRKAGSEAAEEVGEADGPPRAAKRGGAGRRTSLVGLVGAEAEAAERWNKLTVKQLKAELAERGLPVSGVKAELVGRLLDFERSRRPFERSRRPAESEAAEEEEEAVDPVEEAELAELEDSDDIELLSVCYRPRPSVSSSSAAVEVAESAPVAQAESLVELVRLPLGELTNEIRGLRERAAEQLEKKSRPAAVDLTEAGADGDGAENADPFGQKKRRLLSRATSNIQFYEADL